MNRVPPALERLVARPCPVCGASEQAGGFAEQRLDAGSFSDVTYASRKLPEFMTLRLVRCAGCPTVYAPAAPPPEYLDAVYGAATFETGEEEAFAAETYGAAMAPHLQSPAARGGVLEVGAGSGAFLGRLVHAGFDPVVGVEPSEAAIAAADEDLRPLLRRGRFAVGDYAPESLSLFCCFQTLEHVEAPREITEGAFRLLAPGGMIALVTHDYTALLNRLLGRPSPIIDIEHLQLFCPASLKVLLASSGFRDIEIAPIRNCYPLRYWLRLLPLPVSLRRLTIRAADSFGLGGVKVSAAVGNRLLIATKPVG